MSIQASIHGEPVASMELGTSTVNLQATVQKIAELVQEQQSGITRLERENIEMTTQQLAELVASLRNAGAPDVSARGVIKETLAVISTNLALLRALKTARERLV